MSIRKHHHGIVADRASTSGSRTARNGRQQYNRCHALKVAHARVHVCRNGLNLRVELSRVLMKSSKVNTLPVGCRTLGLHVRSYGSKARLDVRDKSPGRGAFHR